MLVGNFPLSSKQTKQQYHDFILQFQNNEKVRKLLSDSLICFHNTFYLNQWFSTRALQNRRVPWEPARDSTRSATV